MQNTSALNSTYTKPADSTFTKDNPANTTYTKDDPQTYDITPARHELPPEPLKDKENYDIMDLKSDDDTDDEENPRKIIPKWAHGSQFRVALMHQAYSPPDVDMIFIVMDATPNLEEIFRTQKRRFLKRTSSAQWGKAPVTHKW